MVRVNVTSRAKEQVQDRCALLDTTSYFWERLTHNPNTGTETE